jgi:hypothetical protein
LKTKYLAATGLLVLGTIMGTSMAVQAATAPAKEDPAGAGSTIGGYEGWWNSTPVWGDAKGLPRETVTVDTNTGEIIDAFNRTLNDAGRPTRVSDVSYKVSRDAAWPRDSIVIVDTSTGKVIEQFPARDAGK